MRFSTSHLTGSTTSSVIIGVFVGALLSFGVQLYSDSVQDRRAARGERARQIERVMTAANDLERAEIAFVLRLFTVAVNSRTGIVSDFSSVVPEHASVNELRTVTALYLPEVQEETQRVTADYFDFCNSVGKSLLQKVATFRPGDPTDLAAMGIDQAPITRLRENVKKLQDKLVDLARKNHHPN